jgi:hypothetical protein
MYDDSLIVIVQDRERNWARLLGAITRAAFRA